MSLSVVRVKGHHCPDGHRMVFDGRIKYDVDNMPDVIEVDGTLYQKVEKPVGYINPEMHMHKETR